MKRRESTRPGGSSDASPNAYQPVGYGGSLTTQRR